MSEAGLKQARWTLLSRLFPQPHTYFWHSEILHNGSFSEYVVKFYKYLIDVCSVETDHMIILFIFIMFS